MSSCGSQLANARLSIHETQMEQASRYPGCDPSDRIERRVVLEPRRAGMLCRLGGLLVRVGQRLQRRGFGDLDALMAALEQDMGEMARET